MIRVIRSITCAVCLIVALSACDEFGRDIVWESYCFDGVKKDYWCCGQYTPRDHPTCLDGGADASADAPPDAGADDGGPQGEADAGADDGGPPATACPWACTPTGGAGFGPFPSYVSFGKETDPLPQPLEGFKWTSWVDIMFVPPNCPACSCVAPVEASDGCALPSAWSVNSTACQGPSSPSVTPFDPPANWAGSCTSANPIAAGLLCEGEPCVKSLVIQPPTIAPCVAGPPMPPEGQTPTPLERTRVIEYVSASTGPTCGLASNCIAPPPDDYTLCFVANDVEVALPCPEGWTDRYTGWREVTDTRVCSACTCAPPEGGFCEVRASFYADDACADERGGMVLTSNQDAKCVDLTAGTALGSKTAEILSYQAGTCEPSTSEIVGDVKLAHPVTYCCLPPLPMPP